jgi:molybdate transport system substrate-binding protein
VHVSLRAVFVSCLVAGAIFGYAPMTAAQGTGSVTIMADASITVPLSLIARDFSREHHMPVSVEFSSTKEQIAKIEQGAEANVLISAKPLWIKRMQQAGLIDVYSRTNIAANRVVLMGPLGVKTLGQGDAFGGSQVMKLMPTKRDGFQFGLADPEYLAEGTYTLEALGALGIEEDLEPHYMIVRNITDMAKSIANYDNYGMMYASDALLYPRISTVAVVPERMHGAIIYQGVVVAGEHMNEAREFLNYLKQPAARRYFEQAGFLPVTTHAPERPLDAL